jgi:uncharacterized protein (TIGR02246 family)
MKNKRPVLSQRSVGGMSRRELMHGLAGAAVAGSATLSAQSAPAADRGGKRRPTPEDYTAIRQVAERYVDAVNRLDAVAWGETFAPDGEWRVGGRGYQGRENVVQAWSGMMKAIPNVFMHVYSGVVDEVNGDTATGRWYMGEYLSMANGSRTMNQICYADTYGRIAGQWYIKTRTHHLLYRGKGDYSGEFFKLSI